MRRLILKDYRIGISDLQRDLWKTDVWKNFRNLLQTPTR